MQQRSTKYNITKVIREEFSKKKRLTLSELRNAVWENSKVDLEDIDVNHRVRSSVYNLQKRGEIKRVADATYESL